MSEKPRCNICRKEINTIAEILRVNRNDNIVNFHKSCARKLGVKESEGITVDPEEFGDEPKNINEHINEISITTTNNIDGYRVKKYIDVESVEIVFGTGLFSEFTAGIGDIFGLRSHDYESKLSNAKKTAMKMLKYEAYKKGGNAVIGIGVEYTEFSGNRVGLILSGTVVEIEPFDDFISK